MYKLYLKKTLVCVLFFPVFISYPALTRSQQVPDICINEFLAYNVSVNAEMTDFDDFSDWIELYNRSDTTVDLSGYTLTDDPGTPDKWSFPENTFIDPGGYLLLWADGYDDVPGRTYQRSYFPNNYFTTRYFHLNFGLSKSGESITLFDPLGELIDSVYYSVQEKDVSVGRINDGDSVWQFFGEPTPGQANRGPHTELPDYAPDVLFSILGGFFSAPQTVSLSSPGVDDTIRFTLDNSVPDQTSDIYSTSLFLDSTSTIRARVYRRDHLPGPPGTQTFFVNENTTSLPVVSLVCDPVWLWHQQTGIYQNQYKEREIPVYLEFYESMNDRVLAQNAGLRLTGEFSYLFPQKPMTIYARRRYGQDEINHRIFPDQDIESFKMLYLRNGGYPDNYHTLLRDAFQHNLMAGQMDIDYQAYRPVVLYLNGRYWGLYNLREKINEHFLGAHHGVNPDNLDILEYQKSPVPDVVRGSRDEYDDLMQFITQNDISDSLNYNQILDRIDIEEYLNYMIAEIYCDNPVWLEINIKWWRERIPGSLWRWIFFDLDHAYGLPQDPYFTNGYRHNTLRFATSSLPPGSYNPPAWSTHLFRRLLTNEQFKNRFIQKISSYLNTCFAPERAVSLLDSLKGNIETEMLQHINRWRDSPASTYYTPLTNMSQWRQNVDLLYAFARNRPAYQRQHIAEYFGLGGTATLTVEIDPPGSGRVVVNSAETHDTTFSGLYFRNVPIPLQTKPSPGYRFTSWGGLAPGSGDSIFIQLNSDTTIRAQFEANGSNVLPERIAADTILTAAGSPYAVKHDLEIDSGAVLSIEAGTELWMSDGASIYIHGALHITGSESDPVKIIRDPSSAWGRWGAICFINTTDSSSIVYAQIHGASQGNILPRDKGAISAYNARLSLTAVHLEDVLFPVFIQNSAVYIRECTIETPISSDYINIKNASEVVIENNTFTGNTAFDTDAIDLDGVSSALVRGNIISNFLGINSDGVDLGETCSDIRIENNTILNCTDKGISVGQGSTALVRGNLIAGCAQGIGIKDFGSFALADRNTFYANTIGIACFEKIFGEGGGSATVVNSVFSKSVQQAVFFDALSSVQISYSLSDTETLSGLFNIFSDPLFANNFRLSANSPCIDSGDPASTTDPDGSRADMGAYHFDPSGFSHVIINEIHYNPANGGDYEFLELHNTGPVSTDISGYHLEGPVNHVFQNISIEAGGHIVLARNINSYMQLPGTVLQWTSGQLPEAITAIILKNASGDLVDAVTYGTAESWASAANGAGSSLELRGPELENLLAENWRASYHTGGSPGQPNAMPLISDLYINEFLASNGSVVQDEYGDFDDWIELFNGGDRPLDIGGFYVSDNSNDPAMWRIPSRNPDSTTIPAGGFILLWADGETGQGLFHLGFRLSRTGENISFVQISGSDTHQVDALLYAEQTRDISFGRNPDGVDSWQYFSTPTPGHSNTVSSLSVKDGRLPQNFDLQQNYPNPFNPATSIRFALPRSEHVEILLFNTLGQTVRVLTDQQYPAGYYKLALQAGDLASGVYIYRIKAGGFSDAKKMLLLR